MWRRTGRRGRVIEKGRARMWWLIGLAVLGVPAAIIAGLVAMGARHMVAGQD